MATSESQKKARDKWLREKVESLQLRVPIGKGDIIRTHAQAQGESMNAFFKLAVDEAMERDDEKPKQK